MLEKIGLYTFNRLPDIYGPRDLDTHLKGMVWPRYTDLNHRCRRASSCGLRTAFKSVEKQFKDLTRRSQRLRKALTLENFENYLDGASSGW